MGLSGHRAVVTGAGGNLGQVVLQKFLDEGAQVVGVVHSEADLTKLNDRYASLKSQCHFILADVTDEAQVEQLTVNSQEFFGDADILLNLVGGFQFGEKIWEMPVVTWDKMMSMNLRAAFLCSRIFIPGMLVDGWGRIINISSKAVNSVKAGTSAYTVSKSGVETLTQVLREELKGTGVSVCALSPSIIDSPTTRADAPKADPSKWVAPEELAQVMVMFCGDEGGLLNGSILPVWGAV